MSTLKACKGMPSRIASSWTSCLRFPGGEYEGLLCRPESPPTFETSRRTTGDLEPYRGRMETDGAADPPGSVAACEWGADLTSIRA